MTFPIADRALSNHTAVLGKTGSGKTSTSKLIVEYVVEQNARVCVIDPVKSDWWGLTSSADGKHPGLPFQILGGPHGHVPLHDGAGAAIGELVATGALPLSILDMADFRPGGHNRFFTAFADTLMRKMRGVLYLVIEEAHEFAPKERSGVGDENMAIYYAKKLATAGRSKGLRMIVCTQAVQLLHNRVLGSCETLVVHRFTAPADRKPVEDWLKGNIPEKVKQQLMANSLAGLADGQAWVCSGGAVSPMPVQFPRIATFDNSVTPEHGDAAHQVVTARVDQQQLRALVGEAVKEAEANDPKVLKARITELEQQQRVGAVPGVPNAEQLALADKRGYQRGVEFGEQLRRTTVEQLGHRFDHLAEQYRRDVQEVLAMIPETSQPVMVTVHAEHPLKPETARALGEVAQRAAAAMRAASTGEPLNRMSRAILIALAKYPNGLSKKRVLLLADYSANGATSAAFASLTRDGHIEGGKDLLTITAAGLNALGAFEPLPTGKRLRVQLLASNKLDRMEKMFLELLFEVYPKSVGKTALLEKAKYSANGATSAAFAHLVGLGYITMPEPKMLRASENLFG